MPLSPPAPRQLRHVRRVTYQGFERDDGLWDIEGELHDSKAYDGPAVQRRDGIRRAGQPVHHMLLRVTVDARLTVQAIEVAMAAHPLDGCQGALASVQRLVGSSLARGWRHAIEHHLGGMAGCTHIRELLLNLATAAFQTNPAVFASPDAARPPRHLGQCTGWAFSGEGVREFYPQFHQPDASPDSAPPAHR